MEDMWERWGQAQISIEVTPGEWVVVGGPDAISDWPYAETLHIITAWNPGSRPRPDPVNERANAELAAALAALPARAVNSIGRDGDGYFEPGFAVWGQRRAVICALGAQFDQDAIYEITADEIAVVACVGERVDMSPRRPEQAAGQ